MPIVVSTVTVPVAPAPLEAPPALAREMRAAWVTPLWAGMPPDWPSAPGLPADSQKAELRALLDRAQAAGLNAIMLHVRTAADALYPSDYAPWSAYLSGRSGVPPTPAYDPLAYAVREAHARGLQLHAWFNPFRALLPNIAGGKAAPTHVTRQHPEWIRRYGTQTWIDPGIPDARQQVLAAIVDVVRRYDVDGVHLDDYFYPYRESERVRVRRGRRRVWVRRDIEFPDDASWRRYGKARGWTDRAAWRRANIDDFVRTLYGQVKATKPWVLVGISPFGIWRSGTPDGVTGLDAYAEIYADSRRWLREGWVDYLAPQLYWPLDGEQHRFIRLDRWWLTQNPLGRHVWPGLQTTRSQFERDPWPADEIPSEIALLRADRARDTAAADDAGHIHFHLGALGDGPGSLGDRLRRTVYAAPALVPASPWLGEAHPGAPLVALAGAGADVALAVAPGDSVPVAWWLVQRRDAEGRWTAALQPVEAARIQLREAGQVGATEIAVTAVNRAGETGPATLVSPAALLGSGGGAGTPAP